MKKLYRRWQLDSHNYSIMSKYYDSSYSVKSDLNDLPFYLELVQRYKGPVLEIACGTGRILLEIAKQGYEVDGIDISDSMLQILKKKLRTQPENIRQKVNAYHGDMRTFSIGKKYKLIIIPFRPMQHLYSIEDQIKTLQQVRDHLRPDGFMAFDVFYPNFDALNEKAGNEKLELEWKDARNPRRIVRRYFIRHKVHKLHQYFEGEFIFRTFENEKLINEERELFKMNYYTYPQMLLLFKHCGLQIAEEYGSFQKEPIDICKEMIFVLRVQNK